MAIAMTNSFVISRVDYCNSLLVGLPAYQTNRIQAALNDSARLIFGWSWRDHATPILRDRKHLLRAPQRIEFRVTLLVCKTRNNLAPDYIASYWQSSNTNQRRSKLRSTDEGILIVTMTVTEFGKRSFAFAGHHLWNNFPSNFRHLPSVDIFKRGLKTLFKRHRQLNIFDINKCQIVCFMYISNHLHVNFNMFFQLMNKYIIMTLVLREIFISFPIIRLYVHLV